MRVLLYTMPVSMCQPDMKPSQLRKLIRFRFITAITVASHHQHWRRGQGSQNHRIPAKIAGVHPQIHYTGKRNRLFDRADIAVAIAENANSHHCRSLLWLQLRQQFLFQHFQCIAAVTDGVFLLQRHFRQRFLLVRQPKQRIITESTIAFRLGQN